VLAGLATARRTGGRAHVLHLSSAGALDLLATARRDGVAVGAETCTHYLTFEAGSIPDGATQLKCCPPIRDARNRERPWRGLADGLIDLVASDHSPARPSSSTSTAATSARPGAASPPSS
jgi:allantoinase